MKGLHTALLFLFISIHAFSQSPEKFSFQSVVRDAQNNIVSNSNVGVRMSILQGSSTGTIVYMETHNAVTNQNGLFTIEVGNGVVQNGNFSNINWGAGLEKTAKLTTPKRSMLTSYFHLSKITI